MNDRIGSSPLPPLIWVVLISTAAAFTISGEFFGFNATGFAWVIPLAFALFDLMVVPGQIKFPIFLWLPWMILIGAYVLFAEAEHAFQRSIMILAPLVVGMAVSKRAANHEVQLAFQGAYRKLAVVLLAMAVIKTAIAPGALAPEVMTGALLCSLFAATYAYGKSSDLPWWMALAFVPVIGVTRMGMVANGVSLPLTTAPLSLRRRIVMVALTGVAAVTVFQSDAVQRKMFVSGSGSIEDLLGDQENVAMSGRRIMWEHLEWEIGNRPWFGHGANASEPVVTALTGGIAHPHNDWLRIRYDYGNVGAVVLAVCMLAQVLHLLYTTRNAPQLRRILAHAGASSFVSFSLFMMTDNIVLYAAFFGNLQFTIIGLAYAGEDASDPAQVNA